MLHVLPRELWLSVLTELDAPNLRTVAAVGDSSVYGTWRAH